VIADSVRTSTKTPQTVSSKKFESRNPKQIQMIGKHKIPNRLVSNFAFRFLDLSFSDCFGPRGFFGASDFEFCFVIAWRFGAKNFLKSRR